MLFQEPPESPYDIRFELFGFPVRIAWTFWLGAAVFGYGLANAIDRFFPESSPGRLPLLLLWATCLFISILIHELGHAFAFRRLGIESSVLLYHFGGLATPRSSYSSGSFNFAPVSRLSPAQDLFVSAAGPLLQIATAVAVTMLFKVAGYSLLVYQEIPLLNRVEWLQMGQPIGTVGLFSISYFYILPSVLWAFLNLLPVYPLDGGRIARSLIQLGGGQVDQALWLSLIVAVLMAVWGFTGGQFFLGILFASLAMGNYQMLQQFGGRF